MKEHNIFALVFLILVIGFSAVGNVDVTGNAPLVLDTGVDTGLSVAQKLAWDGAGDPTELETSFQAKGATDVTVVINDPSILAIRNWLEFTGMPNVVAKYASPRGDDDFVLGNIYLSGSHRTSRTRGENTVYDADVNGDGYVNKKDSRAIEVMYIQTVSAESHGGRGADESQVKFALINKRLTQYLPFRWDIDGDGRLTIHDVNLVKEAAQGGSQRTIKETLAGGMSCSEAGVIKQIFGKLWRCEDISDNYGLVPTGLSDRLRYVPYGDVSLNIYRQELYSP
tara:strand:- start:540 stop:1385 length:846 start_codon:yes stop_codon:yes gene_type:complete